MFVAAIAVAICVARLAQLQFIRIYDAKDQIRVSRILEPYQLPTLRGNILDRNNNILAEDKPVFHLNISYQLTKLLDKRYENAAIAAMMKKDENLTKSVAQEEFRKKYKQNIEDLSDIIDKCVKTKDITARQVMDQFNDINNQIWSLRQHFAWRRNFPGADESLETLEPNPQKRALMTLEIDLAEMYYSYPLIDLHDESEKLEAQLEFVDIDGVEISPRPQRQYPFQNVAANIIGWVGTHTERDRQLFKDDRYSQYLPKEQAGKDYGVERVCETVLRGKRGEKQKDKDGRLLNHKETIYGRDVAITIDIHLQKQIEEMLADRYQNALYEEPSATVVIDVNTSQILAMVSHPTFDLNTAGKNYTELINDPNNKPLISKATNTNYPPGSIIKPIILIAALEEGKVKPNEIISCPAHDAPRHWPNCMQRRFYPDNHDEKWQYEGGNIARNAIKGSCNIYFSVLADKLDTNMLSEWLTKFGLGQNILPTPQFDDKLAALQRTVTTTRNLRQSPGKIATLGNGLMQNSDKRMFGIGQGDLRITVLQASNAMAAIARNGIFRSPRIFLDDTNNENYRRQNLGISQRTIDVVKDGMFAVANEDNGTARKAFKDSTLPSRDITVYGKTGSTQNPWNALFGGFAQDKSGRKLAIAIIVESGQAGSSDAAPLAEKILVMCAEAGYIGKTKIEN